MSKRYTIFIEDEETCLLQVTATLSESAINEVIIAIKSAIGSAEL